MHVVFLLQSCNWCTSNYQYILFCIFIVPVEVCNAGPDLEDKNPLLTLMEKNLPLLSRSTSLAQKLIKEEAQKRKQDRDLERENAIRSIETYINNARDANDMDEALKLFEKAYMVLQTMSDRYFDFEEDMYGPLLKFLIENKMTEKFQSVYDTIKKKSPTPSTLAYYEMLFWIEVGDKQKIQMLLANKNGINING